MSLIWKYCAGVHALAFEVKDYTQFTKIWDKLALLTGSPLNHGPITRGRRTTIDYSTGYFLFTSDGYVYQMTTSSKEYEIYKPCVVEPVHIGISFTDIAILEKDLTNALKALEKRLLYIDQ